MNRSDVLDHRSKGYYLFTLTRAHDVKKQNTINKPVNLVC